MVLRQRFLSIVASQMHIHMLPTRVVHHHNFLPNSLSEGQGFYMYFGISSRADLESSPHNSISRHDDDFKSVIATPAFESNRPFDLR
jgi:hypothetical protein